MPHLHLFRVGSKQYGAPDQWESEFDDDMETLDERKAKLSHSSTRARTSLFTNTTWAIAGTTPSR